MISTAYNDGKGGAGAPDTSRRPGDEPSIADDENRSDVRPADVVLRHQDDALGHWPIGVAAIPSRYG
jgi:hypothetical protein